MRQIKPGSQLRSLTESYILTLTLMLFPLLTLPFHRLDQLNMWIIAAFCLNGGLFLWQVLQESYRRPFSLAMMHWLFCYLFFFLAGFLQYAHDAFSWGAEPGDGSILLANALLTVWALCFMGTRRSAKPLRPWKWAGAQIPLTDRLIRICTVISVCILLYGLVKAGPGNLLSRASYYLLYDGFGQIGTLLLGTILQGVTCISLAFAILRYKQTGDRRLWLDMVLCGIAVFFICSPTGLARYKAATVYIGLMLLTLPQMHRGRKFMYIFLAGMTVAFPALNIFRRVTVEGFSMEMISNLMSTLGEEFLTGNYDAFSMIPVTVEFIDISGITYGFQLLGALLFFVPRALWPGKPIGTGAMMFTELGYSFTNVSAPLPAEALQNFGYPGIVLFALAFGWLFHRLDGQYWHIRETSPQSDTTLTVLYPFLLSLFFFLCRGDMLSCMAFIIGWVVVYFGMVALAKWIALGRRPRSLWEVLPFFRREAHPQPYVVTLPRRRR